jgi:hypothetical protein
LFLGFCAVFKVRGGAERSARAAPHHGNRPAGRRSLKTQQHAAPYGERAPRGRRPDPVDMLGADRRAEAGMASSERSAAPVLVLPRKEVIQPQLPLRLPCYDFTPVTGPTFDGSLPKGVRPPASGVARFRGVTGGVYKARERIHRGVADPRLLATPPSWRRVSASNPNRDRL